MGHYRLVEEMVIADCAIEIEGADLDDLFATAAIALAELMVDPATVETGVTRRLSLRAEALDLLLYDWMSEIIFLKDRDRRIFPRVAVRVSRASDAFTLEAEVVGGVIDRQRTALRADLKAVTLHQFAIERAATGWRARVVIDV